MTDLRELHARTLKTTEALVRRVDPARLDLPTPCAAWDLAGLLAHMTGQNHGFAAAARGETSDATVFADRPVGADPAGIFAASVADVTSAFAEEGVPERPFWLPEVREEPFPGQVAIGFHLLDYVVHGWDVAASIGVPVEFDADILAEVLRIAERVPAGEAREAQGASFGPVLDAAEGGTFDRILRILGRDPHWTPGTPGTPRTAGTAGAH